jgi:hypothetical protein
MKWTDWTYSEYDLMVIDQEHSGEPSGSGNYLLAEQLSTIQGYLVSCMLRRLLVCWRFGDYTEH